MTGPAAAHLHPEGPKQSGGRGGPANLFREEAGLLAGEIFGIPRVVDGPRAPLRPTRWSIDPAIQTGQDASGCQRTDPTFPSF